MISDLVCEISKCTVCAQHLDQGPNPVLTAHEKSKIVIIGQAPGIVVHKSGKPWADKSGNNLRSWMNMDEDTFYNSEVVALIPMGFCYPGKGKTGDLPPRKECAPLWHEQLLSKMKNVELVLLVGKYAQDYYLENAKKNLTETVRHYHEYLPRYFPLPHPSPRNNIWQAKNEWFKLDVIPSLKDRIASILH